MEKQTFKLKYKFSEFLSAFIPCLIFISIFVFASCIDTYRVSGIIGIILTLFPVILAAVAYFNFYLKVENDKFYIRSRFGKKYEFSLSELKSIHCANNYRSRAKAYDQITLKFGETSVIIISNMSGMQEFTDYILEKYENGEILKQVIQRCDYETLKEYQEEYIKKEKNKKRSHTI